MATIATASSSAITVVVKESGARGLDGTPGTDGAGFNSVRRSLIDSPTCHIFKKNRIAFVLSGTLTSIRNSIANFKNAHEFISLAPVDFPREEKNGWLIESARTNLALQSETFDNATWAKSNLTATADATKAPDDETTADQLTEDGIASIKDVSQAITVVNATIHALSVFIKPNGRSWVKISDTANANAGAYFNVTLGTIGTIDAGISAKIDRVANGFYRCSIISTSAATAGGIKIQLADANGGGSYTGNGTSGVFVWGAQVEASKFETSYIKTVLASVTRPIEKFDFDVLNNVPYIDDGFSFLIRLIYNEQSASQSIITIPDTTAGNVFVLGTDGSGKWRARMLGSDAIVYNATSVLTASSDNVQTIIATIKDGVLNLYVNGVLSGTVTSATNKAGQVKPDGSVEIGFGSDAKINAQSIIMYDFVLNQNEITHLS